MTFTPSKYQQAVFDAVSSTPDNLIISAVAGSGKSTTLKQLAMRVPADKSARLVAFNSHIAKEMTEKLAGTSVQATTIHSAGRQALAKQHYLSNVENRKYSKIARDWVDVYLGWLSKDEKFSASRAISNLFDKARLTLTPVDDVDALYDLAWRFQIELKPDWRDKALAVQKHLLDQGIMQIRNAGLHDFTDMIFMPVHLGLDIAQYDFVLVDEAQDLNACQLEFVLRMIAPSGRIVAVGDEKQAIMGFAGADTASFWKIKARSNAVQLPLSVCYRCPTSHLDLARMYVPHIEARENAPEGVITYAKEFDVAKYVQKGDLILCRRTAPLIDLCIRLIGLGFAARVRGRDVAKTLTDMVEAVAKMLGFEMSKFLKYLEFYKDIQVKSLSEREDSEEIIQSIKDRCEALEACYLRYQSDSPAALSEAISNLFSDEQTSVWLSTIHRAKGLEGERVLILQYDQIPLEWKNQTVEQYEQECNLVYVALTRSKNELVLLTASGIAPVRIARTPLPIEVDEDEDEIDFDDSDDDLEDDEEIEQERAFYAEALAQYADVAQMEITYDDARYLSCYLPGITPKPRNTAIDADLTATYQRLTVPALPEPKPDPLALLKELRQVEAEFTRMLEAEIQVSPAIQEEVQDRRHVPASLSTIDLRWHQFCARIRLMRGEASKADLSLVLGGQYA